MPATEPPEDSTQAVVIDLDALSIAVTAAVAQAAGPRVIPMADVEWGMYGQVKGYGPMGERCTTTGYVTKPPRITTRRLGSGGRGTKREASRWLKFTMEMPFDADRRNGLYIGMFAETDAVFTVLEPPADRPLTKGKFLGCRVPVVDLVRGDVFHIWDEPGQHDERGDQRPRYHLQAAPVAVGDGQYDLEVLVAGEVTTRRVNGDLYVDVDDPQETPWQAAQAVERPRREAMSGTFVIDQALVDAPEFPRDLDWWRGFAPMWVQVEPLPDGAVLLTAPGSAAQAKALGRWLEGCARGRLAAACRRLTRVEAKDIRASVPAAVESLALFDLDMLGAAVDAALAGE